MLDIICVKSLNLAQIMAKVRAIGLKQSTTRINPGIDIKDTKEKLLPKKSKTKGRTKKLCPKINS